MNNPPDEPRFETCRCQYCDGGIEFDGSHTGEIISCPHCGLETLLFVPAAEQKQPAKVHSFSRFLPKLRALIPADQTPPVVVPPILQSRVPQPIWFGSEASTIEIVLTSGAVLKIKEVRLYDAKEINDIAAQKSRAAELLNGVSSPYGVIGDPLWVVFATKITGMIEEKKSREAAQRGFALIQKLAERERKLRENVKLFPVGQIQEIENPVPSLWQVPSRESKFVHSGDEFVTVKETEGLVKSIRWSCVESYDYQANK